jgi:hypothetical protein
MVLSKHSIKMMGLTSRKLSSFFWSIKDDLARNARCIQHSLRVWEGVHHTNCKFEWDEGQRNHQHMRLYHPEMSVMAEHSINLGHHFQL